MLGLRIIRHFFLGSGTRGPRAAARRKVELRRSSAVPFAEAAGVRHSANGERGSFCFAAWQGARKRTFSLFRNLREETNNEHVLRIEFYLNVFDKQLNDRQRVQLRALVLSHIQSRNSIPSFPLMRRRRLTRLFYLHLPPPPPAYEHGHERQLHSHQSK